MFNTGGKHRAGSKKTRLVRWQKCWPVLCSPSVLCCRRPWPWRARARLGGDAGSSSLLLRRVRHPVGVGVGLPLHDGEVEGLVSGHQAVLELRVGCRARHAEAHIPVGRRHRRVPRVDHLRLPPHVELVHRLRQEKGFRSTTWTSRVRSRAIKLVAVLRRMSQLVDAINVFHVWTALVAASCLSTNEATRQDYLYMK